MKKIINLILNNLKIRSKLLIVYFIIVIVTVLTIGIYFTNSMSNVVIENSKKDARANSNQIKQRLTETLRLALAPFLIPLLFILITPVIFVGGNPVTVVGVKRLQSGEADFAECSSAGAVLDGQFSGLF